MPRRQQQLATRRDRSPQWDFSGLPTGNLPTGYPPTPSHCKSNDPTPQDDNDKGFVGGVPANTETYHREIPWLPDSSRGKVFVLCCVIR